MKLKAQVTVSDEMIHGALCCAFEGGTGYWCRIDDYDLAEGLTLEDFHEGGKMQNGEIYWHPSQLIPMAEGCAVICCEHAGPEEPKHRLDRAAIERGLQVMADKYPEHFTDLLNWRRCDADTGDAFLQCCLLGELVYG
jgi:hypothetical protein